MSGEAPAQPITISGTISGSLAPQPMRKVNIASPAYGSTYSAPYVRSLYSLLASAPASGVAFSFSDIDYADIVVARNYLISNFYFNKPDCSHILFLDDDMGYQPELIHEMLALQQDVVGVIYPRRQVEPEALHARGGEPFARAYAATCGFVGQPAGPIVNGFAQVESCGTGILLISRAAVARMIAACPDIVDHKRFRKMAFGGRFETFLTPFNKITLEDAELSEDISFCHRWTKFCGGTIWANTARRVQHVASVVVEARYQDLD